MQSLPVSKQTHSWEHLWRWESAQLLWKDKEWVQAALHGLPPRHLSVLFVVVIDQFTYHLLKGVVPMKNRLLVCDEDVMTPGGAENAQLSPWSQLCNCIQMTSGDWVTASPKRKTFRESSLLYFALSCQLFQVYPVVLVFYSERTIKKTHAGW